MIAELLRPTQVVFGLQGSFPQAIDMLCGKSAIPGLANQLREKIGNHDEERFSYIGDGIAVPHLRVEIGRAHV